MEFKISEVLKKLANLVHFDISNNKLDELHFELISNALKDNHTLYGFHNEGNFGFTNEKMFLIAPKLPIQEQDDDSHEECEDSNYTSEENVLDKKQKEI